MSSQRPAEELPLTIEPMRLGDLTEVCAIERSSFPTPWSLGAFLQELKLGFSHCLVARQGEWVVGYCCIWCLGEEAHLLNLAVHPNARRLGVGSALLHRALELAQASGARSVVLEVRTSNRPALELYRKFGFRIAGCRPRYYQDTGEDALILRRELPRRSSEP